MSAILDGQRGRISARLNGLLLQNGLHPLESDLGARFEEYFSLIVSWNARINLTAIRDEEGILSRHFVESIFCAQALPAGIKTLLDFGSGAGFPGIPIVLCRPEIAVTLAESQGKKAAFLREAIRVLEIRATVHGQRAEVLPTRFDCVILRAVDRMPKAVAAAVELVVPGGWLVLMITLNELDKLKNAAGLEFTWAQVVPLPGGDERVLALGARVGGITSQ